MPSRENSGTAAVTKIGICSRSPRRNRLEARRPQAKEDAMRKLPRGLLLIAAALAALPVATASATVRATPTNVDVSQRHFNESEEAIAVNPTNPKNIVLVTNVGHREAGLTAGMFEGVSFDGGKTWSTKLIGDNDNLGDACCDPSLSFDRYGNLFMTYLFEVENTVPIALSTDGGLTFHLVGNIVAPPSGTPTKSSGDNRGLFRFVDQLIIIVVHGEVWVIFNAGGPLFATGAPVSGIGQVGPFFAGEVVPNTNNCTYGDIAIVPAGPIMQLCTLTESGQGGGKLFVNVHPDGLGTGGRGDTDGIGNDDAQFWGAFSTNGGASFGANLQISAGTSNAAVSGNGIDYGDYSGLSFYGGMAHPSWSDNSNNTGNNPDGALHQLDIYTAAVPVS